MGFFRKNLFYLSSGFSAILVSSSLAAIFFSRRLPTEEEIKFPNKYVSLKKMKKAEGREGEYTVNGDQKYENTQIYLLEKNGNNYIMKEK